MKLLNRFFVVILAVSAFPPLVSLAELQGDDMGSGSTNSDMTFPPEGGDVNSSAATEATEQRAFKGKAERKPKEKAERRTKGKADQQQKPTDMADMTDFTDVNDLAGMNDLTGMADMTEVNDVEEDLSSSSSEVGAQGGKLLGILAEKAKQFGSALRGAARKAKNVGEASADHLMGLLKAGSVAAKSGATKLISYLTYGGPFSWRRFALDMCRRLDLSHGTAVNNLKKDPEALALFKQYADELKAMHQESIELAVERLQGSDEYVSTQIRMEELLKAASSPSSTEAGSSLSADATR